MTEKSAMSFDEIKDYIKNSTLIEIVLEKVFVIFYNGSYTPFSVNEFVRENNIKLNDAVLTPENIHTIDTSMVSLTNIFDKDGIDIKGIIRLTHDENSIPKSSISTLDNSCGKAEAKAIARGFKPELVNLRMGA